MISFTSFLDVASVALPNPENLFWIAAFAADDPAVNPNGIKILLMLWVHFFINGNLLMNQENRVILLLD